MIANKITRTISRSKVQDGGHLIRPEAAKYAWYDMDINPDKRSRWVSVPQIIALGKAKNSDLVWRVALITD